MVSESIYQFMYRPNYKISDSQFELIFV